MPTAINAIAIASNIMSGEDEDLEACTVAMASLSMHARGRQSIEDEDSNVLPSEHEMSIQMYYRSTNVGLHHVQADGGCMVYFREPYDAKDQYNMQLIRMPDIKDIPETEVKGKPREYIGKILDCCDKGFSLTCRDGCIYVKRHCRSVLFWSISEDGTRCEKMERDVETKVFDLGRFRQRLRLYREGTISSPVMPEINFSFAQKLCDAFELKACFISFVVRPLRAVEELRTLNHDTRLLNTIVSNVPFGKAEGLEACTVASEGMHTSGQRSNKDKDPHCLHSEHEMSIQMYYRSTNVGLHHVQANGGCMLYFREPYDIEIRRNMQLIRMPDIRDIPETEVKGKPREFIGKILDCCDKGLSLTCRDGCIYVKRHCRSVLFWSTSEDGTRCEKLERDVETKIFDLDRFRQHLRLYHEGSIPSPVMPEINFSFAQKLCDAFELKACFISFVVRPLRAVEELRTLNTDAGSLLHSSHSGLLKFSGPEMHNDVFVTTSVSPCLAQAAAGLGLG